MEEKIKKTRTPKKPTATQSEATAPKATKTVKAATQKSNLTEMKPSPQQIAELAHRLWAERGYQHGHDAEDWIRAEQMLRGKAS
ncbi:MAG TPA: DUF2934 domain-containing protein [Terracidiphilus sp.]|jgi:hypothetical protein|nr:DUF2934 domain-containing protein [Terracidiphilus sp.]